MNAQQFHIALERMRQENLGKQMERRELGLLALRYGIYFNSTMWACDLSRFFRVGRLGPKYVYSFKVQPVDIREVREFLETIRIYRNDVNRKIEHAKEILRRYGINRIN